MKDYQNELHNSIHQYQKHVCATGRAPDSIGKNRTTNFWPPGNAPFAGIRLKLVVNSRNLPRNSFDNEWSVSRTIPCCFSYPYCGLNSMLSSGLLIKMQKSVAKNNNSITKALQISFYSWILTHFWVHWGSRLSNNVSGDTSANSTNVSMNGVTLLNKTPIFFLNERPQWSPS